MQNNFSLSQELGNVLTKLELKLAVAESCTGGLLAGQLTDVVESSNWFERGFVVYSNAAKIELLEVSPSTLEKFGAVSAETAMEMAKGALKQSHTDLCLSITGIAGPGGGSPNKPVGTVFFGLADKTRVYPSRLGQFTSGRKQIRIDSIKFALSWLLEYVRSKKR